MKRAADLEIGLHRRDGQSYVVEMRLLPPGADEEVRPDSGSILVDLEALRATSDDQAYGALLGGCLFGDESIKAAFDSARKVADDNDVELRVRLLVGPTASELHTLRWEVARDEKGATLFTGERVLFSRYVISSDWRPLRPKGDLRTLGFVSNPSDLSTYGFAPVERSKLLAPIQAALGRALTVHPEDKRATLAALLTYFREGFDILYLVCHGKLIRGEPRLWFESEDGTSDRISGNDLVLRLSELRVRPRLIVLASCHSAGTADQQTDEGYMAALGPRLAESGIPAVVAMQGAVSMDTVTTFMPAFFKNLQQDGAVDTAMSVARTEALTAKRPDWWMPILFMRLKSGRVWYVPGFGDDPFKRWPGLLNSIRDGKATAILGSGLNEALTGTMSDVARALADTSRFALASGDREHLPRVAQYLAVTQDVATLRRSVIHSLWQRVIKNNGAALAPEFLARNPNSLDREALIQAYDELLEAARQARLKGDPEEPYARLAAMPFRMYLNTNPDKLLQHALDAAGRNPRVVVCQWNDRMLPFQNAFDRDAGYRPDQKSPLVYQLFGDLQDPDSLVLTEDDYFDYLIGVTTNKELIPPTVRAALANTALMFLGFHIDDWSFRVLFRIIMNQSGGQRRSIYKHVAVQINPEEGRFIEVEAARRFLESYFHSSDIAIYWGSVEDFIRELASYWAQRGQVAVSV
jgi:CHAT domain-containing protein/SIR2-like protein